MSTYKTFWIPTLLFLINACSETPEEPAPTTRYSVFEKAKEFPHEKDSMYGTWMDTSETYSGAHSARRWFYLSRDRFGIGQWCFEGRQQSFVTQDVPATAVQQSLTVLIDLTMDSDPKELPCNLRFPKGHYGINLSLDSSDPTKDILRIVFPQTGEIIMAVRYYAPIRLVSQDP